MVRSSPRASAGFSRLAASLPPSAPPAPISVWASSINKMIGCGDFFTASITPRKRCSNSPFTPAPACNKPRSRASRATSRNGGGTLASAMRRASPSATAVLPTPGAPTRIGLFCLRRSRMSIHWRISASRPMIGSIRPSRASRVRSCVY